MKRLGVRECLVDGRIVPGDVTVAEGAIAGTGVTPAGEHGLAIPGFVDIQVNGFAGVDFAFANVGGYQTAADAMAATGVTSYQPTYICLPPDAYEPALQIAIEAQRSVAAPRLLGVHLEGPFLSPKRIGAHDPANTRDPDPDWVDRMLAWGIVTYTTIAPELPGALEVIRRFAAAGVTVAIGHSDADAATAVAAFDAGATAVTHLFGAQRGWHHRDPGISGASLLRDDAVLTLILDGNHLAPETVEMTRRCAPGRIALITDAISAAGRPGRTHQLGDRTVVVAGGAARLENGTLAGSVLRMDQAVRNFIELGAPLPEAIGAVTKVPARLIGRPDLAALEPGTPADITVLDDRFEVSRVLVGGEEIYAT